MASEFSDGPLCTCYMELDSKGIACYCGDLVQDVPSAECPCVELDCDCCKVAL